jgi:ATP-dependent Clp protease ATP-binding subunit ClpA
MSRRQTPPGPREPRPIGPILAAARAEAELARHGYVGLEHLLIALTRPETGPTAALLAHHGITTQTARDAAWLVIESGRGDGPRFDPATLLATLGIDLDQIRRRVEAQFGPNAIDDLYASPVGWNLRPRGPLCGLGISPQLKRVIDQGLGRCWDKTTPQLCERLLLHALDSESRALTAVLDQLAAPIGPLRSALTEQLRIAS